MRLLLWIGVDAAVHWVPGSPIHPDNAGALPTCPYPQQPHALITIQENGMAELPIKKPVSVSNE